MPSDRATRSSSHGDYGGSKHRPQRSERGRRRSSLTHVNVNASSNHSNSSSMDSDHNRRPTSTSEHHRKRGKSASARTSRRGSAPSGNNNVLDRSGHSHDSSTLGGGPPKPRSYPRHRRRSRSTDNHRRSRSKSIDRSNRSLRADELLPERLNQMMKASSHHDSQLEQLALAILVAEDEGDLDQDIQNAVENLPTHLLDPSKVRLNMQW